MTTVTIRELSQDTSGTINRVEAGDEVHVTKNGKLVAIIVPASEERRRRATLVSAGLVESPGMPGGLADIEPLPARPGRAPLSELLSELRDED